MNMNALSQLGVTPFNGYGDMSGQKQPEKPKNGIMNVLSKVFEYGAPEAFEQGRQKKHQNALASALQSRDFGSAADAAFASGNINGGLDLLDYNRSAQSAQSEAGQAEKVRKLQGMAVFAQNMRQIPEAERGRWAMDNWQMLEPIVGKDFMTYWQESGGDVSDASLDEDLLAIQTALGQGPTAPEYGFQNVDGQLFRTDKVAGEVTPMTERHLETITPYQQAQLDLKRDRLAFDKGKPQSGGITIGADGTVTIGGPAGAATTKQMASQDASQMAEARKRANDLQPVLQTLYSARAELAGPDGKLGTEDDLKTGSFAPLMQSVRRFIPGEQDGETSYDNFDALSKEFGIEKLAGIGGNDTERELLTAIQTGPNMGAQSGSNIDRINRQISVFEFIGESRRNFQSRWLADVGSLSRTAPNGPYAGMTFDEALSVFQRQQAQSQGLIGNTRAFDEGSRSVFKQRGDMTAEDLINLYAGDD